MKKVAMYAAGKKLLTGYALIRAGKVKQGSQMLAEAAADENIDEIMDGIANGLTRVKADGDMKDPTPEDDDLDTLLDEDEDIINFDEDDDEDIDDVNDDEDIDDVNDDEDILPEEDDTGDKVDLPASVVNLLASKY